MSRLTSFLRLLSIREDEATVRARDARGATTAAQQELLARRQAHDSRPGPAGILLPSQLLALRLQGMGSQEHIEGAQAEVERRRSEQADADEARSVAAVRRKSVERVTQRRMQEAAQAAQAAARRSLDELAMLRKVSE